MAGSDSPVVFEPIFKERIWGGRNLAASFGKKLPANKRIGESWEIGRASCRERVFSSV